MNGDELNAPEPQTPINVPLQPNNLELSMLPEPEMTAQSQENAVAEVLAQLGTDAATVETNEEQEIAQRIIELKRAEASLKQEIAAMQAVVNSLLKQMSETQDAMGKVVTEALSQLEQRKQALQLSIEQLERRQERIRNEMRTTFAGTSQDLAIRVQGFKDYLIGSLQDLASSAEQLQLPTSAKPEPEKAVARESRIEPQTDGTPQFAQQQFQDTTKQIRRLIDQYRTKPDYYGPAWQLRRTFEPVHAERISDWFFTQGGRGALRTMGSRLQNILIASAATSILYSLYGDRVRTLILANSPERLGEWRRGLQDCLGIGRPDFGPERGVVLFETSVAIVQKAERLVKAKQMPFIIIDDSEEQISLALLQFPLWLAFAPDPRTMRNNYDNEF
jgi:FtsZ-binding cell division protein ZapB